MNFFGILILTVLFFIDLFEIFLKFLNLKQIKKLQKKLPENLIKIFSVEKLKTALNYQEEKNKLDIFTKFVNIPFFYLLFITGFLNLFITYINNSFNNEISRGIFFFIAFILYNFLINLPFTLYDTFKVEKKYGFNRMTVKLFIKDTIISGIISFVILSVVLAVIITFIKYAGNLWWLYAAIFVSLFSFFITYVYPTFIAPLFNKFEPLKDEDLKNKIFQISKKANFPLDKIFQMDASKRSTHSNAYFTGFGKKRRIVLFDTLLEKHLPEEIVSILAHEIGHFKLGHIKKMLLISNIMIFVIFYFMGLIINDSFIYNAFGFDKHIYIGLFVCMILFSPGNFILQPFMSFLSRKHEFEADKFAVKLINQKDVFINTLIKLYKDNLANPLPAKLYKIFYYSHPTLLERIEEIKK